MFYLNFIIITHLKQTKNSRFIYFDREILSCDPDPLNSLRRNSLCLNHLYLNVYNVLQLN
jgi:hypothetical protein